VAAPLIATLALDAAAQARFEALRRRHFPAALNIVPAHLTLFHHLPGEEIESIVDDLEREVRTYEPFALEVTGLRFLGRGVAYSLRARELTALRTRLADAWADWLTPQDRQRFQAHVTVQNKAEPAQARALLEELSHELAPFPVTGEGVLLWHYLGGPWEKAGEFRFGRMAGGEKPPPA